MPQTYTIGRLAAVAGVHIETIRYYQRRNLIPEPARPAGRVRRYTEADAERLRFIKRAQSMGFTLIETQELLALRDRNTCAATRALAVSKLTDIDARIRQLRRLRKDLAGLVSQCDAVGGDNGCPIIKQLDARPANEESQQVHQ